MSDIKWIKITTDIFDDEKMLLIESFPSADSLIVIWFKLICLAGKNNNDVLMLTDKLPITEDMLCVLFHKPKEIICEALNIFEEYGMVERKGVTIKVRNIQDKYRDRNSQSYKEWRKAVFERDKYTCQCCGAKGVALNAHHKKYWCKDVERRFDISNGITLCEKCHKEYHKKYGRR